MSNDDIVNRLRTATVADSSAFLYKIMTRAANEIEHLHNELADWKRTVRALEDEIQHLRQLGDSLVLVMQTGSDQGWDEAIDNWKDSAYDQLF